MRRFAPLGLRTRLIAAFLLVAAICAVSTAALTYQQARNAILKQSQDTAVSTLRDLVDAQTTQLPVGQAELQRLVGELGKRGQPHPGSSTGSTESSARPPTRAARPPRPR